MVKDKFFFFFLKERKRERERENGPKCIINKLAKPIIGLSTVTTARVFANYADCG